MLLCQDVHSKVWMHNWLDEVNIKHSIPGLIKGDSCGAIALTKNTKDHGKVKHIDIWHHYIWELLHSGAILIEQVPSADNLADSFTKPLACNHHHHLLNALNINWVHLRSLGSIGNYWSWTPITSVTDTHSFHFYISFSSFLTISWLLILFHHVSLPLSLLFIYSLTAYSSLSVIYTAPDWE